MPVYIGSGLSLVLLDQMTKLWARQALSMYSARSVISPLLEFQLVHNFGAAYGIFQNQLFFLIGVTILVLAGCWIFRRQLITSPWSEWGVTFLVAGAVGNLIDRASVGFVTDFINIQVIPVFNIADMCINIGIGSFIVESIVARRTGRA